MNHAAWLLAKLNDPSTPREQYMRYWEEYQDLLHRQAVLNEEARKRFDKGDQR